MVERTIWVVRHGLSEGIEQQLHQRPRDKLTELGRKQAEAAAKRLAKESITCVVRGTLTRQIETAEIIDSFLPNAEWAMSSFLDERTMPRVVEGRPWSDPECQAVMAKLKQSEADFTWPIDHDKGETRAQMRYRAEQALRNIAYFSGGDMAVVSSGGIIKMMLSVILLNPWTIDSWRYFDDGIGNLAHGSIQRLTVNVTAEAAHWRVTQLNDTSHLADV